MAGPMKSRRVVLYVEFIFLACFIMLIVGVLIVRIIMATQGEKFEEVVFCMACEHIFITEFSAGENSPFECERCGKRRAYLAMRCKNKDCPKAGEIFPLIDPNDTGKYGKYKCTVCSSPDVEQLLEVPKSEKNPEE